MKLAKIRTAKTKTTKSRSSKNRTSKTKSIGLFLFSVLISATAALAGEKPTSIEQLEKLATHKIMNEKMGAGVAIALIENGKTEFTTVGFSELASQQAVKRNQLFEIGSITKVFTAIALADMIQEGKVSLDDPIQKYLPDNVKAPTYSGKAITLRDLATHASGLPRLPTNLDLSNTVQPYQSYDDKALYAFLNEYQLPRAPGETKEYSNLGFGLLGHLLGRAENSSYQAMINKRVIQPLKLKQTYVQLPESESEQLVSGHDQNLNKASHWQFDVLEGAGSIISNVEDMAKFLQANMNSKRPALAFSQKAQTDFGNPATHIGLGWIISKINASEITWHNGGTAGFRSFIGFNKKAQKGIVILANSAFDMENYGRAYLTSGLDELVAQLSKKDYKASENELDNLVGVYQLAPSFSLTVTREGKQLMIQATNQSKFPVYANSATEFYYKVVEAKVTFELNKNGVAKSVALHQNGQVMPGKKLP